MGSKIFSAAVCLLFLYLIHPLILPIAMGGVLAVLFSPWLETLNKKKISPVLGSSILTLGITSVLLLPMSALIFFTAKTGMHQLRAWKTPVSAGEGLLDSFIQIPRVHGFMVWITGKVPVGMPELADAIQELAASIGARLAELFGEILGHLPGVGISVLMIVLSVYFFLVEGPALILFFRRNSLFKAHQTEQLIATTAGMCRSVILASLVSGAAQALLEVVTCLATGTPNAAMIGLLILVGSFIPLVGSSPFTLGVAVLQIIDGRENAGIVLLVMALVIMAVDNAIRPIFLRGSANLHPFLGFIAAFGGLQTIGFLGVFLGPIIAALLLVVIQILLNRDENRIEI